MLRAVRWGPQLTAWARDTSAQNVVEYGLLIATIAAVILMGTLAFGQQLEPWFNGLANHITTTGT
ncbi:MAG TPA: hypothetical protein VGQ62_04580 [Chloroflexota bacterium]|jgi:Flp pilus assembly pilin Flp|nr:hypothetical protein [Chloroflexota bacterium]